MNVTGERVASFLGGVVAADIAQEATDQITLMARAYTRGRGFDDDGQPCDEIAAVILTAAARLASHTSQTAGTETAGPFIREVRAGFQGWSLAETYTLDRYRVTAA